MSWVQLRRHQQKESSGSRDAKVAHEPSSAKKPTRPIIASKHLLEPCFHGVRIGDRSVVLRADHAEISILGIIGRLCIARHRGM